MKMVWLESAIDDVVRLRKFIEPLNNNAALNAASKLIEAAEQLEQFPSIGKPVQDLIDYRDLSVRFGAGGYIIRYRIQEDFVYIVHLRHYREMEFK